ncbi:MAG: endonuclease/exonuclease/phosphatase family protein, partial [Acidobacteria bacterium]|nr:endonuclease/exonuclease/phosphatase family protein [Acidobacteriota bacterium]
MNTLRVVTYNIHKCRGLDRRVRPERIAAVLRETGGEVIALQEVLSIDSLGHEQHQARCIADALGMDFRIGENRKLHGGAYGNVTLSRLPLGHVENFDITWRGRERRGCLRSDVHLGGITLHVFNIHLGTAYIERRFQGRRLVSDEVLNNPALSGSRLVVGDFNEWTHGLASRLLSEHFKSADVRYHLRSARTYPGILPLVHLDHV